jgi:uncharacterized glyoxalase superfamily protein PhnB
MLAEKQKAKPAPAVTNAILPYLFFNGRCEEAVNFYKRALGGEIEMLMRWKDNPDMPKEGCAPGMTFDPEKIMHASLKVGDAILMASDGMPQEKSGFQGSRFRSPRAPTPSATAGSTRWPKAARCRCRWARPSSPSASAPSPTSSASRG